MHALGPPVLIQVLSVAPLNPMSFRISAPEFDVQSWQLFVETPPRARMPVEYPPPPSTKTPASKVALCSGTTSAFQSCDQFLAICTPPGPSTGMAGLNPCSVVGFWGSA